MWDDIDVSEVQVDLPRNAVRLFNKYMLYDEINTFSIQVSSTPMDAITRALQMSAGPGATQGLIDMVS